MITKRKNYWTIRFVDKNLKKYIRITSPKKLGLNDSRYWYTNKYTYKEMIKEEILAIERYYLLQKEIEEDNIRYKNSINHLYDEFCLFLNLNHSSRTSYEYKLIIKKYLFPYILLNDNAKQINIELIKKVKSDVLSSNLKTRSINSIFTCINKFLSFLAREDQISFNDLFKYKDILKNIRQVEIEKKINFLTLNEIDILLRTIKNNQKEYNFYLLFACLFYGALRIGELLALTFDDVNYINNSIRINKQLNISNIVQHCKSKYSCSTIYIPKRIIDEIRKYQISTNASSNDRVFFPNITLSRVTLKKYLDKFLYLSNINKKITLHGLRHSMASYMFSKGISILDVSLHLRHKNPSVTLSVYTHKITNDSFEIINNLDLG